MMLDLHKYNSLGETLRDALDRWPDEICLIEADRERENVRLTYRAIQGNRACLWRRACKKQVFATALAPPSS